MIENPKIENFADGDELGFNELGKRMFGLK